MAHNVFLTTFVDTGFPGWYDERSAADGVLWRAAGVGEDTGEDDCRWTHTRLRVALDCCVGKVHRSSWQHISYEWVQRLSYISRLLE